MTQEITRSESRTEAVLPPHIRDRMNELVHDLSNDDLPMALLDLAQLYRALRAEGAAVNAPIESLEEMQTLIFGEDGAIDEICMGPDRRGHCPRAEAGQAAACAGKSIMNKGWTFRVAPDAEGCPLVSLGLAHQYLRAAIGSSDRGG